MDNWISRLWQWAQSHWRRNPIGAALAFVAVVLAFPFWLIFTVLAPLGRWSRDNAQWAGIAVVIVVAAIVVPLWLFVISGEEKPTIKLVDGGWETLDINNAIAKYIIENGYDYPVDMIVGSWQEALANGDVDVMMEGWQQNASEWYTRESANGTIVTLATVYESGPQFFMVPQWVADEYQIKTIYDMEGHWELFKDPTDPTRGLFYNCPKGSMCAEVNPVKLESYGLHRAFNIVDAVSYGALDDTLISAQLKKDPVFGYYWSPTPLMRQHDWYVLEEPPYSKGCWSTVTAAAEDPSQRPLDQACEYPDPGIQILANSGLEGRAPDVVAMLRQMNVGLEPPGGDR